MQGDSKKHIRKISFDILYDVFFDKKLLNVAIDEKFNSIKLDDADKSYVRYECAGVIEKIDEIDAVIKKFSKVKLEKLDRAVLLTLRIGIFELEFMDKVPSFATINELVDIVKTQSKAKGKVNSSFVNAILRNVDRDIKSDKTDKKDDLGQHKKSDYFTSKNCYFRIYNDAEEKVLAELDDKNIEYKPYDGAFTFNYAKVYKVNKYKDVLSLDNFRDGNILISDASSIYLTDKLAYFIKERNKKSDATISMMKLLDVCASPGGKILGLIDLIYDDFYYFYAEARDISESKILKICENINRLKVLDLNMLVKDASIYDELDKEKYDVVICDVPCSGLGVVEKKPDIKLNFTKEKMSTLINLQSKILDVSSKYVKPSGIISYSTCTTTYEENEDIVNKFLKANVDFEKIYEKRIDIGDENKADGFYMCFMKKL